MTLLRTYASTASTSKDRSRAIAFVTCGQALGLTSGPAMQLLFTWLNYPGYSLFGGFHLNMYTAPAYFACALNFFGALTLYLYFQEKYAGIVVIFYIVFKKKIIIVFFRILILITIIRQKK